MATVSNKQLMIDGLHACGYERDMGALSRKYQVFIHPDIPNRKMLIGKGGGLRVCLNGEPIAQSRSLTGRPYARALVQVGKRKDCYSSTQQARMDLLSMINGKLVS